MTDSLFDALRPGVRVTLKHGMTGEFFSWKNEKTLVVMLDDDHEEYPATFHKSWLVSVEGDDESRCHFCLRVTRPWVTDDATWALVEPVLGSVTGLGDHEQRFTCTVCHAVVVVAGYVDDIDPTSYRCLDCRVAGHHRTLAYNEFPSGF